MNLTEDVEMGNKSNRDEELMFARALQPLAQCKQPSAGKSVEACMYYACSICDTKHLTGELIQLLRHPSKGVLPTWVRDTKELLNGNITEQRVTQGCTVFRSCKKCFERAHFNGEELTRAKFHKYICCADASWNQMATGQYKIGGPQYKDAAYYYVKEHKKEMKDLTNLPRIADGSQTPGLLEGILAGKGEEGEDKASEGPKAKKSKPRSLDGNVPVIARLIKVCVENPRLNCGLPALTELIVKLRKCRDRNAEHFFNLALTATDYMTVLISSPGKDGTPGAGPKVLLKYLQGCGGYYTDAASGDEVYCEQGYCPQHEALWTPCRAGKTNYWIDPAFGKPLERTAPYLLMYCPGDTQEGEETMEVFRAEEPSPNIADFIAILKAHANGVFDMKDATTLKELWWNIMDGLKKSQDIEAQVWDNLPKCKFGFKIRNIYDMEEWNRKSTLRLTSCDEKLGITEVMLRSRHTAIGYDLSKIDGYDPEKIIRGHGWQLLKTHLMTMLSLSDYRHLQNGLEKSGKELTHARMKMLRRAASGYDF